MLDFMKKHPIIALFMLDTIVVGIQNVTALVVYKGRKPNVPRRTTRKERLEDGVTDIGCEVIDKIKERRKKPTIGFAVNK